MKNIFLLTMFIFIGGYTSNAQKMSWIPSKYVLDKECLDNTNCNTNTVCYKLQYIPGESGVLTSYTTGFIADCDNKISGIKINASCLMNDKSEEVLACEQYGKLMLHCSGNSGNLEVTKNKPVYLHQVCFQLDGSSREVNIVESDVVKLTTSINLQNDKPVTEFAEYNRFRLMNNIQFCDKPLKNLDLSGTLTEDGQVHLDWEPAQESTGGMYSLLRSNDGFYFEEVHSEPAKMLTTTNQDYSYRVVDELKAFGEFSYKVEYTAANGQKDISNLVTIFYKDFRFSMSISPNPAADMINIFVTAPQKDVALKITDIAGKLIKTASIVSDKEQVVDVSTLPAGMYNVIVISNDRVLTEKLIVIE